MANDHDQIHKFLADSIDKLDLKIDSVKDQIHEEHKEHEIKAEQILSKIDNMSLILEKNTDELSEHKRRSNLLENIAETHKDLLEEHKKAFECLVKRLDPIEQSYLEKKTITAFFKRHWLILIGIITFIALLSTAITNFTKILN